MKKPHFGRHLALLVVLLLVMAACADDEGSTTTAGGGDDTTTTAAAAGCAVGEIDGDLSFYNWSEYIDPELITEFESTYGVDVIETFYESNEAMLAQIQAGVVYDLIVPSDYMISIMVTDGLLYSLDKGAIPNLANVDPQFVNPPFDPNSEFSVPYQWGTTGLGVDLAVLGEDFEESWGLIFDPDMNAGLPVSMLNDSRETMGAALKYLGYSLNSTSEAELQEAADLISSARDIIIKFDSDQYTDDLVNGEVAISHGYNGNFFLTFDEIDGWDDYYYFMPQEGGTVWVDNMAIPTDAEHPCTAHTFMNFILDAEKGAQLTNWNFYASPNAAAMEFIDPEILEDPAIFPDDVTMERLEFITDTGAFELNYQNYFTEAKS